MSLSAPIVTLSIVSHGQGHLIAPLLEDIDRSLDLAARLIVTLNIPENDSFLSPYLNKYNLLIIRNEQPKGFGANHNAAFAMSESPFFAVVNPDIRSERMSLGAIISILKDPSIGACGPLIVSPAGSVEDNARRFPSVKRIVGRVFRRITNAAIEPDYDLTVKVPIDVDWLAGMFVAFRADAYATVNGFDEGYFMYLEDADICRRLHKLKYRVLLDTSSVLIHDARRASHRSAQHFLWHMKSMYRFLFGSD
jgi:N-acetylglucosaminyl-diphospho-decaprenol L-rhamnosyltransferase